MKDYSQLKTCLETVLSELTSYTATGNSSQAVGIDAKVSGITSKIDPDEQKEQVDLTTTIADEISTSFEIGSNIYIGEFSKDSITKPTAYIVCSKGVELVQAESEQALIQYIELKPEGDGFGKRQVIRKYLSELVGCYNTLTAWGNAYRDWLLEQKPLEIKEETTKATNKVEAKYCTLIDKLDRITANKVDYYD